MRTVLPPSFYLQTNVVGVAKELLGKVLCTRVNGEYTAGLIVETEAYRAPDDKACHAYGNRFTERTRTMFQQGGRAYVYICYGIHHLFNVVTAPEGMAHAVLVRAIEPLEGLEVMMQRRKMTKLRKELSNGPGKFTVAMGISKQLDNQQLIKADQPVWIEDADRSPDPGQIVSGPRVGMRTAGECSNWPWRFRIKDNEWTSYPDQVYYTL